MAESFINYIELPNSDKAKLSLPNNLVVGDKIYNGKAPITITAADLGLSQALKFVGKTSTSLADGDDKSVTIIGKESQSYTPMTGDVVLDNSANSEFAWINDHWEELGSEQSHALKTIKITAGTGLTGGGDLSEDRTISINYGSGNPEMDGTATAGTSDYPARADHVHPSDTTKFNISGGTITGATTFNANATFSEDTTATFNSKIILGSTSYGRLVPSNNDGTQGQIFFKLLQ